MRKIQIRKPKYSPKSDFGINGKKDITVTARKMISALTKPEKAVESAPDFKNTVKHSFLMLTAVELLLILITGFGYFDAVTVILFGLLGALLYAVLVPMGAVLLSSVIWTFGTLMGGKQNFESQSNAFVLAIVPIFILISVAQVMFASLEGIGSAFSLVLMLYALYSIGSITRKVTELPTWKVVVSLIMALVVSIIFMLSSQTMGMGAV